MINYVLGINGGKKDGRTSNDLKKCLGEANKLSAQTKLIELSDFNILPISRVTNNPELDTEDKLKSDDTNLILKEIKKADGIIFTTPAH